MEGLGDRIRQRRQARGLKQQELATRLRVSAQAVSKWERGENDPDIVHLPELARLLEVSTDWLLGVHDEAPDKEPACVALFGVATARLRSVELGPAAFGAWCRAVAERSGGVIQAHGGLPLKCSGPAVLAAFEGADAVQRCAQAIVACAASVEVPLKIGVCAGPVWRGRIGRAPFEHDDVFGDPVSVALSLADWLRPEPCHGVAWCNPPDGLARLAFDERLRGVELPDLPELDCVGIARLPRGA